MSELAAFLKDMYKNAKGLGENALSLGTAAIAEPVAGYAAMYDPANGAAAIREGMTYKPRSQEAKMYQDGAASALGALLKPVAPVVDTWKKGVDIAGDYSPAAGAALSTVPTALGVLLGAKPALQTGRQVSKGLGVIQDKIIANASTPRTLNTGFRGQRGAINPNDFNLVTNPDGTVTLYHGTTRDAAQKIIQDRKLLSAGEPDVYMTTDPKAGYGDGTAVKFNIDPKHIFLDDEFPSGRVDFRMPAAKGWRIQNPEINTPKRPLTEFEQAHLLAQQRAALPVSQGGLGLAPDNTAMDRARAMGFDVDNPVYHGTGADIEAFNTGGKGKTSGSGAFFTDNTSVASTYSDSKNGVLYPILLNNGKVVNVAADGANWNWLKKNVKLTSEKTKDRKALNKNLGKLFAEDFKYNDALTTDDLAAWANNENYDAIKFNQVKDRGPQGVFANQESSLPSNNTAVFKPENIRSRFAAFDPFNRESSNLLAQYGAVAPTAGIAAYLYGQQNKDNQ